MKVESVDFFYLAMPEITDEVDGSQDALLVRVRAGGFEGWGECEAAPLPCIAAWCCPVSHGVCKPVKFSVEGATLNDPDDIRRINAEVRRLGLDLLQTDHTLSGVDVALWDVLARSKGVPVYELLGDGKSYPKMPYASVLLQDTPQATYEKAKEIRRKGFRAAKFGWGPWGAKTLKDDIEQAKAAREGLGDDGVLLIDAGTIWKDDPTPALERAEALRPYRLTWLEEPFRSEALDAYRTVADAHPELSLAGGEGANNYYMAHDLVTRGGVKYLQIDAGRIGGITTAYECRLLAESAGITYVNHTFTSALALSASLQAFAGVERFQIAEYPTDLKPLAQELSRDKILLNAEGYIRAPNAPGLGITPDLQAMKKYLVPVRIEVSGKVLYETPEID